MKVEIDADELEVALGYAAAVLARIETTEAQIAFSAVEGAMFVLANDAEFDIDMQSARKRLAAEVAEMDAQWADASAEVWRQAGALC